jgi:dihydroorotase
MKIDRQSPDTLTITQPDDWHVHLRDGAALDTVVPHTAAQFARAIVMPNLKPGITSVAQARAYARRIQSAVPPDVAFEPLMTLYLTDNLDVREIALAKASQSDGAGAQVVAVKLYPAGATTNSAAGVSDLRKTYPVLEAMQRSGLPLLVHGEVTTPEIDLFDREAVFIDTCLAPLRRDFPELKIVLEHITTKEAAQYVQSASQHLAATITAHHLLFNRNAIFTGGLRPHYYCLPVLKREQHRLALVQAATSGQRQFFLGTDSAPHAAQLKEHASGCAGCYTAHAALEMYAEVFDSAGALGQLEAFASFNGADFYGLARNSKQVTLQRSAWQTDSEFPYAGASLVPLRAGEWLPWKLQ